MNGDAMDAVRNVRGDDPVVVAEYNPDWPRQFEVEAKKLKASLGETARAIHHVGSTAVHGLAAKPVIDVILEVADVAALDGMAEKFDALGYTPMGEFGIPGRRFFVKFSPHRSHHLHAFQTGSREVVRHLAFRDYLQRHGRVAREYGELKRCLAKAFPADRQGYSRGKSEFIGRHEARAVAELSQGPDPVPDGAGLHPLKE